MLNHATTNTAPSSAQLSSSSSSQLLAAILERSVARIRGQLVERGVRSAQVLKTTANTVLSGARSGRVYHGYTASAPGEPPAMRTGAFRASWQPAITVSKDVVHVRLQSGNVRLAAMLEHGTSRMAPRPYQQRILQQAKPEVLRLYQEPYLS